MAAVVGAIDRRLLVNFRVQVEGALNARDAEDQRHTARSVRHLLSNPPTRANLERLLDVASR
jgi:hypothetical protein